MPRVPRALPAGAAVVPFRAGGARYVVIGFDAAPRFERWKLTPAEIAVARRLLAGDTTAEIARRRGVSEHTIENQLAAIYRKLGVTSRRAAAVLLAAPAE